MSASIPLFWGRFLRLLTAFAVTGVTSSVLFTAAPGPHAAPSGTPRPETAVGQGTDLVLVAATAGKRQRLAARGNRVIRVAAQQAGDPYRYGASGPNAFDCSGLTSFVYRHATGESLPRSSAAQRQATRRITPGQARRGDLVFFHGDAGVYHVAIYAGRKHGDRMVWHSPRPGSVVHKAKIWTGAVTYGRV